LSRALNDHAVYWLERGSNGAWPFYLVYLLMVVIFAKNNCVVFELNIIVAAYEGIVTATIERVSLTRKHNSLFYRVQFFPKIAERTVVRFCHQGEIIGFSKHVWSAWIWRIRYSFERLCSKPYNIFDKYLRITIIIVKNLCCIIFVSFILISFLIIFILILLALLKLMTSAF